MKLVVTLLLFFLLSAIRADEFDFRTIPIRGADVAGEGPLGSVQIIEGQVLFQSLGSVFRINPVDKSYTRVGEDLCSPSALLFIDHGAVSGFCVSGASIRTFGREIRSFTAPSIAALRKFASNQLLSGPGLHEFSDGLGRIWLLDYSSGSFATVDAHYANCYRQAMGGRVRYAAIDPTNRSLVEIREDSPFTIREFSRGCVETTEHAAFSLLSVVRTTHGVFGTGKDSKGYFLARIESSAPEKVRIPGVPFNLLFDTKRERLVVLDYEKSPPYHLQVSLVSKDYSIVTISTHVRAYSDALIDDQGRLWFTVGYLHCFVEAVPEDLILFRVRGANGFLARSGSEK